MTTTETLRTLINEANPELLELKFGCELRQAGIDFICVGTMPKGEPITVKKEGAYDSTKPAGANLDVYQNGKTEILGTPPNLSHLLIALGKKEGFGYMIQADGVLAQHRVGAICTLDLTKPPLQQTLEVQEALVDILRK